LEVLDLFTLDTGIFIDEISDPFQTSQLQSIGITKRQSFDSTCTVIVSLGTLNLVVEQDDLGAGTSENFVAGSDVTENAVGLFHHE
jgi:hypothetical protein